MVKQFEWFSTGMSSLKPVGNRIRAEGMAYRKSHKPIGTASVHKILRSQINTGVRLAWKALPGVTRATDIGGALGTGPGHARRPPHGAHQRRREGFPVHRDDQVRPLRPHARGRHQEERYFYYRWFLEADLAVKKHVLSVVLSNCSFLDRKVSAIYRKPFDIIAEKLPREGAAVIARGAKKAQNAKWLPFVEDIRTALFENAREIHGTIAGLRCAGLIPNVGR